MIPPLGASVTSSLGSSGGSSLEGGAVVGGAGTA